MMMGMRLRLVSNLLSVSHGQISRMHNDNVGSLNIKETERERKSSAFCLPENLITRNYARSLRGFFLVFTDATLFTSNEFRNSIFLRNATQHALTGAGIRLTRQSFKTICAHIRAHCGVLLGHKFPFRSLQMRQIRMRVSIRETERERWRVGR